MKSPNVVHAQWSRSLQYDPPYFFSFFSLKIQSVSSVNLGEGKDGKVGKGREGRWRETEGGKRNEIDLSHYSFKTFASCLSLMQYTDEDDDVSDDVIVAGFAALCHFVAECRDTARAAIAAKRKTLDRRSRDNVRDVVSARARFEQVKQQNAQVTAQLQ